MIQFYNTINRKKEKFKTLVDGRVGLYTCGPTVYDFAHIGNLRAFIFEDLLRRFLQFSGLEVFHIMNITDIDDKTIRRSQEEMRPLNDFTNEYTMAFFEDLDKLNIVQAHHYPRATDFVSEMIDTIKVLENKGYTYKTDDGSVFFKISEFKEYGKLARLDPDLLKSGERVEDDEYEKEEGRDFALWKGYKETDGNVFWDSPWGKGRPGWHIECSVMSTAYLGEHFDIHCGGVDNIFPHHENEIAQSCAASGKPFVNYWLHNEHLLVEGQKMSKSIGNFYSLRDLLDKGFSSSAIRYTLISTHYRSKLNFTSKKVKDSQKCINKLIVLKRRFEIVIKIPNDTGKDVSKCDSMLNHFSSKLEDDLNISGALGELFSWVNLLFAKLDKNKINYVSAKNSLQALNQVDSILGVLNYNDDLNIDDKVKELINERSKARSEKNWKKADEIRIKLDELGVIVEDTKEGVIWKRK